MLTPAADTRAADWIVAALTTFAKDVTSLVPAGFETYVRVFHPAGAVRWREIAAACGTTAHPRMQLHALTGSWRSYTEGRPGLYDHPPREGTLPAREAAVLASVLGRHTATPASCSFAVWEGFAAGLLDAVRAAPRFEVPGRGYHLLHGPVDAIGETIERGSGFRSANLWWPEDHAWCVATEIDLNTTYVGCARGCGDELLAGPDLETLAIDQTSGIAYMSDELNPAPARPG